MKRRSIFAIVVSVLVLVALSLAVFGVFGIIAGAILLAIVVYVRRAESRWRALVKVAFVSILPLLAIALLLRVISVVREAEYGRMCNNNLKQIHLALCDYRSGHGSLPFIQTDDSKGMPRCSWRVLLLADLEETTLLQQYKLGKPWNGVNNHELIEKMPPFYRCLMHSSNKQRGATSYVAVTGPDGTWLGPQPTKTSEPNPVWVVETCDSAIAWTEPRDISLDALCNELAKSPESDFSSNYLIKDKYFFYDQPLGTVALFADGGTRFIPVGASADVLRAALMGDRNKEEELRNRDYPPPPRRINWPNCVSFAGLVVWFILMLAWPRGSHP